MRNLHIGYRIGEVRYVDYTLFSKFTEIQAFWVHIVALCTYNAVKKLWGQADD